MFSLITHMSSCICYVTSRHNFWFMVASLPPAFPAPCFTSAFVWVLATSILHSPLSCFVTLSNTEWGRLFFMEFCFSHIGYDDGHNNRALGEARPLHPLPDPRLAVPLVTISHVVDLPRILIMFNMVFLGSWGLLMDTLLPSSLKR